ncbi:hypothetical protein Droror1_Dr00027214 [Drosera rotundifolia]
MMGNVPVKSALGYLRIVAAIIIGARIEWAFIMLNLWKENIEEAKSNPKRKTYLRMISLYLFKLGKLPKDDGVLFPSNKFISFRRKEFEGLDKTSEPGPSDGQTLKRKKNSDAGAPQKKQKRSARPIELAQTEEELDSDDEPLVRQKRKQKYLR